MAQAAKIIDLTLSFIPTDPVTFPDNKSFSGKEDAPYKAPPIVPYEGFNFLPTGYGYKSYFGTETSLAIDALTSRVDKVFIMQTPTFVNVLVALCEDGIWTKEGETTGAWQHAVVLAIPEAGSHKNWSYCNLANEVFMYRAGETHYYKLQGNNSYYEVDSFPNIVVFAGQVIASTVGFADADVSYRVAYKKADGAVSAPSNPLVLTLSPSTTAHLTITRVPEVSTYRVYRTLAGNTVYWDVDDIGAGLTQDFYDRYATASGTFIPRATTLPDTSWMPVIEYSIYEPIAVLPTFLNMEGQIGIFKAGSRLGFWDSANSISWSSLDDYADFTPSITTLAGSAIFSDVVGRIVNILPHEEGFIIYATKSIVHVRKVVDATFQWDPKVLLSGAGISFPEEACASYPDSTHFVFTSAGLYKIEKGQIEIIVPEVYDFLKESKSPVFLKVMEGRHLALQVLDQPYMEGLVHFNINEVPPLTYTFPADLTVGQLTPPSSYGGGNASCFSLAALGDGATEDQQGAAAAAHNASGKPAKKSGTNYQPIFTPYFSTGNVIDPDNIEWGHSPCATTLGGVDFYMCPNKDAGKLSGVSDDLIGKLSVAGNWNTENFVATQLAIWKKADSKREAFLAAILGRHGDGTGIPDVVIRDDVAIKDTDISAWDRLPGPDVPDDVCTIGTYVTDVGAPYWGFNGCSMWISRHVTGITDIQRIIETTNEVSNSLEFKHFTLYNSYPGVGGTGVSATGTDPGSLLAGLTPHTEYYVGSRYNWGAAGLPASGVAAMDWQQTNGSWFENTGTLHEFWKHTSTKTEKFKAYNRTMNSQRGVFGIDTGWLEFSGWSYTDVNGATQTLAAGASCVRPSPNDKPPTSGNNPYLAGMPVIPETGTVCGVPATPIVVPDLGATPIVWEPTSVTLPGTSFLLQEGSIGPVYPTYYGALVYDLHLKKWGKFKTQYKQLLDYSPINSASGAIIPYEVFGIEAGLVKEDGKIYLFNEYPLDSYIKYGKIGYYRLGMTDMEEVRVSFREASTGVLETSTSLNGRDPESVLERTQAFTAATQVQLNSNVSGRWHSITLRGNYDIVHIEFRGTQGGRR